MHLTISRAALSRELAVVAAACAKSTTIPILGNVRLDASDGLKLTGTDLELAITSTVECEVKEPGSITLPKQRLLDLMRVLDGDVTIRTTENNWATVTAGRSKVRIAGMSVESFPELPAVPEGFPVDAAIFARMLSRVVYAISTEETRFTLNGAMVEFGPTLRCVATDGHRLALAEIDSNTPASKILMPKRAIGALDKIRDGAESGTACMVATDDNHLFFRVGNRVLTARKITGSFPDYARVMPKDCAHAVTISRESLQSALEGGIAFADERSHSVRLTFTSGEVTIAGTSVDAGEYEQSVACDYSGDEFAIGFNARYLLDFLNAIPDENIIAHLIDAKSAMELRPAGGDGTRYVTMPMRL